MAGIILPSQPIECMRGQLADPSTAGSVVTMLPSDQDDGPSAYNEK